MDTLDEIIESFELLDDWEERYRVLIDLGKKLPPFPEDLKRDEFLVRGCTSKVWMVVDNRDETLKFQADSEAHIVKGLVALLYIIFNNMPIRDLSSVDIDSIFKKLSLDQNLSPNRRNGFYSMVERIRRYSV